MKRLLKLVSLPFAFCFLLLALPPRAAAQQEFRTEYSTTYLIDNSGKAQVTQNITLINNFSTVYAMSYNLSLEGKKPNNIQASQNEKDIPVQVDQNDQETKIAVLFPDAIVGRGKERSFTISYTVDHLATQNGQVWDLTIPRLSQSENFNSYDTTVITPKSFGRLAYISPQPQSQTETETSRTFTFKKDDLTRAGVVGAFGDFQVFSFSLAYHINNPYKDRSGKTEIALVPDTAYQRVYYSNIEPKPQIVKLDEDGNWIATYLLKPGQTLDIQTAGGVQIFAKPQDHYQKSSPPVADLAPSSYWQTQDPTIVQIAQMLGPDPKRIYDYTVKTLSYNYDRVSDSVIRLGAKEALSSPKNAICTEFTDVFVALARAAGVPSREINGYAYTDNPQVQPLSLVADVLHAWPEYWDEQNRVWRPVDPTWGNTTGGVDFFDKFDMSHITFAIHGHSADNPPPAGSYKLAQSPQRDVSVAFGQLPQVRDSTPFIKIKQNKTILPFFPNIIHVTVYNPGPVAIYQQPVSVITAGLNVIGSTPTAFEFIAPFQTEQFDIAYRVPLFSKSEKSTIQVLVGDYKSTLEVSQSSIELLQIVSVFLLLCALLGITFAGLRLVPTLRKYVYKRKPSRTDE